MKEREEAAKRMAAMEPQDCPILLDKLDDAANKAYAALPERLYVVHEGSIAFKGDQGPLHYKVSGRAISFVLVQPGFTENMNAVKIQSSVSTQSSDLKV